MLRNWYEGSHCRVKTKEGELTQPFVVERGVKQGSVISPILFLLVMNPLLIGLQQARIGLSVNDFFAGGFLHADDIRTLSTSVASLEEQVSIVRDSARKNFLKLNIQKCEISRNSSSHGSQGPASSFTDDMLVDANCPSHRVIKKSIREVDREKLVQKCYRTSLTTVGVIDRGGSWPKLWDSALHLGSRHTTGLRNLS